MQNYGDARPCVSIVYVVCLYIFYLFLCFYYY